MKKVAGNIIKMKKFISGNNNSKIPSDEKTVI